jgi:hypothetical protein
MTHQGKHLGKINVAVARELVGYLWIVLQGWATARAA